MDKKLNGYKVNLTSSVRLPTDGFTQNVIQVAIAHFKLPFVVLLPDGLSTNKDEPEMTPIAVVGDKVSGELKFLKCINEDQKRWGSLIASEDIFGEFSYSIGQVVLKANNDESCTLNDLICNEHNEVQPDQLVSLATGLINKFVNSYKIVNKNRKDWIPEITVARLSPWHQMKTINYYGKTLWAQEHLDYRGTGIGLGTYLDEAQLIELQRLCINSESSDLVNKYITLANRHKRLRDFHSFCVFSVVAIEHWLFKEVRRVLVARGLSPDDIDNLLISVRSGGQKVISREDGIKLITGDKNFKNKSEYKDYIEKVVYKRDSIVHARSIDVSEQDAIEMINIIDCFQHYIMEIFQETYSKEQKSQ